MSNVEGQIEILLQNPFSSETIYTKDLHKYLKDENNILIFLDDDQIPYCMKRSYFINLLMEDFDYECDDENNVNTKIKYYNLSKLFLNVSHEGQVGIIIKMRDITHITDVEYTIFKLTSLQKKKKYIYKY